MRYATETSAIQFLFSFTFRWITFLNIFFRTPKKKTWTIYSLWFLQNLDETMTAGSFLGGLLSSPPFRLAVIIVYYIFQKILHPQDPPTTGSDANSIPPLQNIPRKYPERACQEEQNGAKFLLCSTFQRGVMSTERKSIETMDYSPWF